MRTRLRHLWETLTSGYWFVPAVMMLAAVVAAFLLLYVDRSVIGARVGWLYAGGADGAKTLLSTVAGSVITVAGVVFSITIAALTQASSQFGPRLLRNFMRDTGNQAVLGTFVGTFLYCLLVLRTIHGKVEDGVEFVPQASVTVAVLLAATSIAVLVYFIHHVSASLQAPAVVAGVREELERVIERLPEDQKGAAVGMLPSIEPVVDLPADFEEGSRVVPATIDGYVQAVDYTGLVEVASKAGLILRLAYRPGQYVIAGTPLARAWPAARWDESVAARCNAAFICGRNASSEQDVEHGVRQLVEVAVRALSPGINDPFTAINCIDALGSCVSRVAPRGLPGPLRFDEKGQLRLVVPVTTFEGIVDGAFNQIRQYGRGSVPVTVRLLEVITACAGQAVSGRQRQVLRRHAEMVYAGSREAVPEQRDRDDVRRRWEAAVLALDGDGGRSRCDVSLSPHV